MKRFVWVPIAVLCVLLFLVHKKRNENSLSFAIPKGYAAASTIVPTPWNGPLIELEMAEETPPIEAQPVAKPAIRPHARHSRHAYKHLHKHRRFH